MNIFNIIIRKCNEIKNAFSISNIFLILNNLIEEIYL